MPRLPSISSELRLTNFIDFLDDRWSDILLIHILVKVRPRAVADGTYRSERMLVAGAATIAATVVTPVVIVFNAKFVVACVETIPVL